MNIEFLYICKKYIFAIAVIRRISRYWRLYFTLCKKFALNCVHMYTFISNDFNCGFKRNIVVKLSKSVICISPQSLNPKWSKCGKWCTRWCTPQLTEISAETYVQLFQVQEKSFNPVFINSQASITDPDLFNSCEWFR